jgi:Extensin-like protein C-terminus
MQTCKHQPVEFGENERFGIFLRSTLSSWPNDPTGQARPQVHADLSLDCCSIPKGESLTLSQLPNEGASRFGGQSARQAPLAVLMNAVAIAVGTFRDISPTAASDARPLRRPGRRHPADNEPCRRRSPRFELANGETLPIKPNGDELLRSTVDAIRVAACGWFTTVLGPGSDAAHAEHLHVDILQHGSSDRYRICQ